MKIKAADGKEIEIGKKDTITLMQEQINELLATVLTQQMVIEELQSKPEEGV